MAFCPTLANRICSMNISNYYDIDYHYHDLSALQAYLKVVVLGIDEKEKNPKILFWNGITETAKA